MTLKFKFMSVLVMLSILTLMMPHGSMGVTTALAGGYCDWAQFIADVTIPDGVPVDPGRPLTKTWQLKNIGTCWWTRAYKLVFVSGAQMGGISEVNLPVGVAPGDTIDVSVNLTAPMAPGMYIGYWKLQNADGGQFGIGLTATNPFYVKIEVVSKSAPVYDFVAQASSAVWVTEASGRRPFPGVYGDPNGFVQTVVHPVLETGIPSSNAGILMAPPAEYNEHIYGVFPAYTVKKGDRFQAFIGCEYGSELCDVNFVLLYQDPDPPGGNTKHFGKKSKAIKTPLLG